MDTYFVYPAHKMRHCFLNNDPLRLKTKLILKVVFEVLLFVDQKHGP